jgi:hypothetical protein
MAVPITDENVVSGQSEEARLGEVFRQYEQGARDSWSGRDSRRVSGTTVPPKEEAAPADRGRAEEEVLAEHGYDFGELASFVSENPELDQMLATPRDDSDVVRNARALQRIKEGAEAQRALIASEIEASATEAYSALQEGASAETIWETANGLLSTVGGRLDDPAVGQFFEDWHSADPVNAAAWAGAVAAQMQQTAALAAATRQAQDALSDRETVEDRFAMIGRGMEATRARFGDFDQHAPTIAELSAGAGYPPLSAGSEQEAAERFEMLYRASKEEARASSEAAEVARLLNLETGSSMAWQRMSPAARQAHAQERGLALAPDGVSLVVPPRVDVAAVQPRPTHAQQAQSMIEGMLASAREKDANYSHVGRIAREGRGAGKQGRTGHFSTPQAGPAPTERPMTGAEEWDAYPAQRNSGAWFMSDYPS